MTLRPCLPLLLLLALLLPGCGADEPASGADAAADATEAPPPVDPADLEREPEAADPATVTVVPDWQPVAPDPAVAGAAARRQATRALEAGRAFSVDGGEPGALDYYVAALAARPDDADTRAARDDLVASLVAQATQDLRLGRLDEARRLERVLAVADPDGEPRAALAAALPVATQAQALVARGERRARAGRWLAPAGRSAVDAYREALAVFPDYQPARDGLVRVEAELLNQALAAAQDGDYPGAERLQADAARVLPGSVAVQDMAARLVELRQARAQQLLDQGHAAVDAQDLALAQRRYEAAAQVAVHALGLDALRERIALARLYGRFRPGEVFREPLAGGGAGPELVVIPQGRFMMGSPEDEAQRQDNEGPRHEVRFARGFALGRTEVTVEEFGRFVEATGYRSLATRRGRSTVYDEKGGSMSEHARVDWRRDHAGAKAAPALPVVHVAFEDAEAYVAWLSAQTGQRYRLPSEAEFEYALRAGSLSAYPWGQDAPDRVLGNLTGDGDRSRSGRAWANAIPDYADGHWGPAPVRSYPAEGFDTYDLIGNVSEWVQDCWHESYRRAPADGSAWVNPGCEQRVIRGASWASTLDRARSAYRQSAAGDTTHARVGFRVAREL